MNMKFNATRVKSPPPGTSEAQQAEAVSGVAKVDQGNDDDGVEERPGRFGQSIFRHAQAQAKHNAQLRADNRRSNGPTRRSPPPGSPGGTDDSESAASAKSADDGMASHVFRPVTSKGQHGDASDDSDAQQHQRGREGVFLAQARGRLGPEQRAGGASAANAAAEVAPFLPTDGQAIASAKNGALQQFTQRAIAALNRVAASPESAKARQLLLAAALDSFRHNEARTLSPEPGNEATGLSGVRQVLLERMASLSQKTIQTQTSEDLNCLLPLLALNTERPRTNAQAQIAEAKLLVMLRQQGG
jgi:hypothetical protein